MLGKGLIIMSLGANLSIMGLYNNDDTVLDLMVFPDGMTDDEQQTVKDNLLIECAELEFLYPAPTVAKNIIGIWSKKELPYWQRVYDAAQLEYNPIENYRRNENETIIDDRSEEHSGSDVNTAGGSDSSTGTAQSQEIEGGTDTITNKISGYDSNTLVDNTEASTQYGHTVGFGSNTSNSTTYGRTDTLRHGEKIDHDGRTERRVLAYGNIGVTTSQEMLTQEMEVAKIINVMNIIIESFKNRFCLMVY